MQRSRHGPPTDRASLRLLHGARRRQTQGAVPPTDRASLRLLHGARQRRTQGAVRVSAGGGRRYLHLLLFSETMFWVSLLDTAPSQHTAVAYPSDSRCVLISGTGWRRTQRACSSLPLAFVWRVLVAAIRHLTPAGVCLSGRSDVSSHLVAAPLCEGGFGLKVCAHLHHRLLGAQCLLLRLGTCLQLP